MAFVSPARSRKSDNWSRKEFPTAIFVDPTQFVPGRLKGYICVECMFTFIHYVLLHPLPSLLATVDRGQGSHAAVGSRDFWRADQTLPTGVPTPQSPFVPLPERLTANEVYHNQNCWAHTDFHEDSMWMCFFYLVCLAQPDTPSSIHLAPPAILCSHARLRAYARFCGRLQNFSKFNNVNTL